MNHRSFTSAFLLAATFLFLGVGCVRFSSTSADGGLFVSENGGSAWEQRVFVRQGEKSAVTIGDTDILDFAFHPTERETIIASLNKGGAYKTSDRGKKWEPFLPIDGAVTAFDISAKQPATMFAISGSRLLRTTDGGEHWLTVFTETRPNVALTDVIADAFDAKRVYLVFSNATIARSTDGGTAWEPFFTVENENRIIQVLVHPKDTRVITVATESEWLYRTTDGGATWTHLRPELQQYSGSQNARLLTTNPADAGSLFYVSNAGLLVTRDGGVSWTPITTLTDARTTPMTAIAVHPAHPQRIAYTASGTLYTSGDGGKSWSTVQLPSKRLPTILRFDPRETELLYLGVRKIK